MDVKIEKSWKEALAEEFEKPYFAALARQLHKEKAEGKVIFDPELFRYFEENYGEDSLYHKDIAGAHSIDLSKVQGGAFVGVGDNEVKVSGYSTQFGGVEDYKDEVLAYFESYFDCPVTVEV